MKLITGTGIAASALMVVGGTSAVALSQSASANSPLGVPSGVTAPSEGLNDFDATEIDHLKAEHAADDVQSDDAAEQLQGTEPEDTTDGSGTGAALGQEHAAAMRLWAQCVADAASGQKTVASQIPPKLACGEKPLPPGLAKKMAGHSLAPTPGTDTGSHTESDVPDTHGDHSWSGHNWSGHNWGDHSWGEHGGSHQGSGGHAGGSDGADGHGD